MNLIVMVMINVRVAVNKGKNVNIMVCHNPLPYHSSLTSHLS